MVTSIKYSAKRKNIPLAGIEAEGRIQETPRLRYEYNPHLPPVLRSSQDATGEDRLPELLSEARKRALTDEEARTLADALRQRQPWLEWSGKREKPWFEVEPVALHMHERISTQAILKVLAREDVQRDLFADPQQDYAKAVQFYKHEVDWSNRMILGDSLQVMASLARREDLARKVQMIYIDPPYGIKFSSNFQPQLGQRDVKDKLQDLTREPETVKAYRDTWTLGIHSYLAYLRDRLMMAKELLTDSGSIFVQISDENLHRVRCVMDEVFGEGNFCAIIAFVKTSGVSQKFLPDRFDHLIWFAKDKQQAKYRQIYLDKSIEDGTANNYGWVELPTSLRRGMSRQEKDESVPLPEGSVLYKADNITSQGNPLISFEHFDKHYTQRWKTNLEGLKRLASANRLHVAENSLQYVRYLSDFIAVPVTKLWSDTATGSFTDEKIYVVQTGTKTIERCLQMTTDPGDLVLDPTCGSGTTAYVAEQWGRRWITCDTSRVALALAKHRMMTAKFDFYRLRELNAEDVSRNPDGTWIAELDVDGHATGRKKTFQCRTVPHITLKSIARNTSLDPIFEKHEPLLAEKLAVLNREVATVTPAMKEALAAKLVQKHREEGASAVTDADCRRWLLPDTSRLSIVAMPAKKPYKGLTAKQVEKYRSSIPQGEWKEWEVPFDTDAEWPQSLRNALTAYREAWRAKMDEVNDCIAANAQMEELVDKPETANGVVRVAGPFTMEGVIAVEDGPDSPIGGEPDELDMFDGDIEVVNAEAHLEKMLRLLKATGVDFPENKNMKFNSLELVTGVSLIHFEGQWMNGDGNARRVAVSVGPEVGNISSMQVEEVIRSANRRGYDDVVFAGFGFDAAAQEVIESENHPNLRLHMALIRPDVAMGDLLKTQPGSQLFSVFSAPRIKGPDKLPDGEYVVEVEGMDVYDPVSNTLFPTDRERIAAWFIDTDYDGRTFCICQAFFPDKSKWAKLAKALGSANVVDEDAFDSLSGLRSLAFPRPAHLKEGEPWKVAVKVIDPRGNEGLRVLNIN
ncbi:hypothetical protein BIU88_09555 [Chlorobaculum limnaeum]|uniref:site-specific DNA-methyltransferase (adenine-specific) n=2 Tax=Chlorobaculum limnaeum TaxID=274537 RepID=A0A1D8D1S1_CHLLM|nr:hypothetical protein BIU88_09555 [Chlorobaculum limnaeum]